MEVVGENSFQCSFPLNKALFQLFAKRFVFSTLGGHFGLWSVLPVVSLKCHQGLKLKKNLEWVIGLTSLIMEMGVGFESEVDT